MNVNRTLIVGAALLPALLGMTPEERGAATSPAPELWIFFSPGDGDFTKTIAEVQELAKTEAGLRVRPVLLVDDLDALKRPTEALAQNVKALRALIGEDFSMRVWDEEGLALARMLSLERLPAVVRLERDGGGALSSAHVAYGVAVNLKELCRCDR